MEFFLSVCLSCLNIPYRWGGSDPLNGFDCSGYTQWVLRSVGMDPSGDQSAQALYDYFSVNGSIGLPIKLGTLIFYGESVNNITHVSIALSPYQHIEAGGGDSSCTDIETAKLKGACIRIRKIGHRKDIVATIHPSYASIGCAYGCA